MKALIPFILPLVVLIILGVVFWRWVQNNSNEPAISDSAASVQVMEVDQATTTELARGASDVPTVEMTSPEDAPEAADNSSARIRYQIKDNAVSLLVLASLATRVQAARQAAQNEATTAGEVQPTPSDPKYIVWFKPAGQETLTRAFELEVGKGGFMGTASVSLDALPMTVYITTAETMADVPANTWFEATIPAPTAE